VDQDTCLETLAFVVVRGACCAAIRIQMSPVNARSAVGRYQKQRMPVASVQEGEVPSMKQGNMAWLRGNAGGQDSGETLRRLRQTGSMRLGELGQLHEVRRQQTPAAKTVAGYPETHSLKMVASASMKKNPLAALQAVLESEKTNHTSTRGSLHMPGRAAQQVNPCLPWHHGITRGIMHKPAPVSISCEPASKVHDPDECLHDIPLPNFAGPKKAAPFCPPPGLSMFPPGIDLDCTSSVKEDTKAVDWLFIGVGEEEPSTGYVSEEQEQTMWADQNDNEWQGQFIDYWKALEAANQSSQRSFVLDVPISISF